jgi:hypothetical protein
MAKKINSGLIERLVKDSFKDVNKLFWKEIKRFDLVKSIIDLIAKGISPVANGRFQKYSESYIKAIRGLAVFFKRGGKLISIDSTDESLTKRQQKSALSFAKKVSASRFNGKKRSPVNLKVSGEMHKGLKFDDSTGKLEALAPTPNGKYNLWEIHDEGKGVPERRLLPTRPNERFTRRVDQKITEALIKVLGVKTRKRFLDINFKIKK